MLRRLAAVAAALLLAGAGGALASRSDVPDLPDLTALLPSAASPFQVAPVWVDPYTRRNHVLYRFDSVLMNLGGTLDLVRVDGGHVLQAVWSGGRPPTDPDPAVVPSGAGVTLEDRTTAAGASLEYEHDDGHEHFHFHAAARYELLVPGAESRVSAKVGFCMFDSWTGVDLFPYGFTGTGDYTWCAPKRRRAPVVRMGLSPGIGDWYPSQVANQWVDVTGLPPGDYTLRATANPEQTIDETTAANDVVEETRTIPGAVAHDAAATATAGVPTPIDLSGSVVAPEIPGRLARACEPSRLHFDCYVTADANGPLAFRVVRRPRLGRVQVGPPSGLHATATYRARRRSAGTDSFTYVVTDARGLTSLPATVTVTLS